MPFLPVLFDKPVEEATEWIFHKGFETFGGPDAVTKKPAASSSSGPGRLQEMMEENRRMKRKGTTEKEKEL